MSYEDKIIQDFKKKIASQVASLKKQDLAQFRTRALNLKKNIAAFESQMIRSGLVGITSSGKSSLLNTLLGTGTRILKEQSKATTNMIVFCSKSEEPELEIHFNDGESYQKKGEDILSESIWKYTSEDENPQNKYNVKFIKLSLPTFMLEEGLEIADTPGLDAFGHSEHEDLTLREFLPQANLILYLSSIRSPMKEVDRKIINKIMDADQRIIFVQTCKGAVVEQKFSEDVTRSVEEQLVDYREKFEKAISGYSNLKDSPIVQVETNQAMEFFKTGDKIAWRQSGLDELVYVVSETTNQIKEEFKFIGLRRLVDESISINQLILNLLKEENEKADALETQTAFLREVENCLEEIKDSIETLFSEWFQKLEAEAIYKKYRDELSEIYTARYNFNPMHDKKFETKIKSINEDLKQLKSQFLDTIDANKKRYNQMLKELGMDVRRIDYQNVSKRAFFLPNVQKKRLADALGKKKDQPKDITGSYIDKNKFVSDLEGSVQKFVDPLAKHLEWWRNTMNISFIAPLKDKIAAITDDISKVGEKTAFEDAQKETLTTISSSIEEAVNEVLPVFDKAAIGRKIKAYSRYIGKFETVKIADKNIFLQLSNRLFENLFHSHYLQCIDDISPKNKKSIVLVSPHPESSFHFLQRLMRLDQDTLIRLNDSDLPYSVNASRKVAKVPNFQLKGELRGMVSFFVLANDEVSFKIAQKAKLFEKADVLQVIVDDLHRVGSALRDMVERFIYFDLIYKNRKKLLITYPAAAHFQQNSLHVLVNEVMAEVGQIFQPEQVRWFVYENFETRYGYFSQLAQKMIQKKLKAADMLKKWKLMGLPLDDPFSEEVLVEQFRMVVGKA